MRISSKQVSALPVMKTHCSSCPFKPVKGIWQNVELANAVIARTFFNGQQICRGTEGRHWKPRNRCKGAYDHNYVIYDRMGFEPDKYLI